MSDTTELHARLLDVARRYDPAAYHRSLLSPYRDVLLMWRAKFMSYEQIAATLMTHGIKVSPAGVGVFCRRTFSKAELERARREVGAQRPAVASSVEPSRAASPWSPESPASRRGPKIARSDY